MPKELPKELKEELPNEETPKEELRELTEAFKQHLIYYKTLGVKELPAQKAVRHESASSTETLEDIRADIGDCTRCRLHLGRTHIVFGEGNPHAELMFVGEGPGHDEDLAARPFVGRAGQLLTKIIEAMKFKRSDVYIANVVKCRPPSNRQPMPDEAAMCGQFLYRQIAAVNPKVIVCLGSVATHYLLQTEKKISSLRGHFTEWRGIQVMPTYHPAYLLRNPEMKKEVWRDMKKVMEYLKDNEKRGTRISKK